MEVRVAVKCLRGCSQRKSQYAHRQRRMACDRDESVPWRCARIAHLVPHDKDILLPFQFHDYRL
jgi:hypothetical protein